MSRPDTDIEALRQRLAVLEQRTMTLEKRNWTLEKINRALMERVEAGPSDQGGAWGNFEHAVFLAEQVRERTEALNTALGDLKRTNQALKQASSEAQTAHRHLQEAIESISDAFVLYDRNGRLLLANSKFSQFWQLSGIEIHPGLHRDDIHRLSQDFNLIQSHYEGASQPRGALLGDGKVFRLCNGSWVQISERGTGDGGLVVLYKDITALIENERALRERALATKSRVLQMTLDNLSQGVVLVNQQNRVETWNGRFAELAGLDPQQIQSGIPFQRLMRMSEVYGLYPGSRDQRGRPVSAREQTLASGRVLEIRTHPMPSGEFVNTYTDITERSRAATALAASEHRIRLITDAVPALIAYVNRELVYEFTNRAYEHWYGYERKAILGRRLQEVVPGDQLGRLQPYIDQALTGETVTFEIADPAPGGVERYVVKTYVPQRDGEGRVLGFYVLVQDITERRRTAALLEQRVQERTRELTGVNLQLRQEIDERRQMETRLREAKKEAEQANHSKTRFLAAASHDLLQPMNAARLFTASLLEQPLEERTRSLANALNYSLEDVETLLAALVDISKLDAGVVKADITAFGANDLLANLANEYRTLARQAGLEFDFQPTSAVIASDSQLLARILRNFLSNAVRYTPRGRILLGCRRRPDGLAIEVWDTGLGIAADKLKVIFEEFNRLQDGRTGQDRGLGLGLAIVDKMSGILDHPVAVRSEPGAGSCFSVQVPYGRLKQIPSGPAPGLPRFSQIQFRGRRVLVLDNESAICEAMATLLGGWGFEVITATDWTALLAAREGLAAGVDLVLADYHLNDGATGLDVVGQLARVLGVCAPVVMITANYTNELKQEVRDLGYRLLNKPVRPAKLKAVIQHLLEQGEAAPAAAYRPAEALSPRG